MGNSNNYNTTDIERKKPKKYLERFATEHKENLSKEDIYLYMSRLKIPQELRDDVWIWNLIFLIDTSEYFTIERKIRYVYEDSIHNKHKFNDRLSYERNIDNIIEQLLYISCIEALENRNSDGTTNFKKTVSYLFDLKLLHHATKQS